jgi:hypothetical protein
MATTTTERANEILGDEALAEEVGEVKTITSFGYRIFTFDQQIKTVFFMKSFLKDGESCLCVTHHVANELMIDLVKDCSSPHYCSNSEALNDHHWRVV